jgi:tRNA pseudouridine synthase 10
LVKDSNLFNEGQKKAESSSIFIIPLCKSCQNRNLGNNKSSLLKYSTHVFIKSELNSICFICKNFFEETLPAIIDQIRTQLSDCKEQIPTIDVGTILPYQFYENEDYLRSMFQIRGNINIKNQINSQIREKIKNATSCKIDHSKPEVRFDIIIQNDLTFSIIPKNKEFFLLGRYRKLKRGIIQKNKTKGKGKGLDSDILKVEVCDQSIESFVNKIINETCKPNSFTISWTGGEDKNSLVMGSGRPFLVKANGCTSVIKEKRLFSEDGIEIEFERIDSNDIESIHRYKQAVKVHVKLNGKFESEHELDQKISSLVGKVQFDMKKKTVTRNIYESRIVSKRRENIELLLNMDNGIPIKQFIGGNDPIEPCLSDVLKLECECINFDIMEFIPCK